MARALAVGRLRRRALDLQGGRRRRPPLGEAASSKEPHPGADDEVRVISAQFLTLGPESGRDLSFSPDGDQIAVFARRERGRQLFIFSARGGGVVERIPVAPDMPLSPAFSPDGRRSSSRALRDVARHLPARPRLEGGAEPHVDEGYDTAPVFSPDGKYLYHTKVVAGLQKIVRFPWTTRRRSSRSPGARGTTTTPPFRPTASASTSPRPGAASSTSTDRTSQRASSSSTPTSSVPPSGRPPRRPRRTGEGRLLRLPGGPLPALRRRCEEAVPAARRRPWRPPRSWGAPAGLRPGHRGRDRPREDRADQVQAVRRRRRRLRRGRLRRDVPLLRPAQLLRLPRRPARVFIWDTLAGYSNINAVYFNLKRRFQWGVQAYDDRTYFTARTSTARSSRTSDSPGRRGPASSASTRCRATPG